MPPCASSLFKGKLEGNSGKDRSQRSNFLFDKYTDSPIIGMFDAEVCFVAPFTPSYFARKQPSSKTGNTSTRLQVNVLGSNPIQSDHWGVDSLALGLPTPLDFMWLDVFPIIFWRSDVTNAREHLIRTLDVRATDECAWADSFDRAFAAITNSNPTWGYRRKRNGYSLTLKIGVEVLVKAEHDFYREKWQKEKEQN